jgi:hypothetical protein
MHGRFENWYLYLCCCVRADGKGCLPQLRKLDAKGKAWRAVAWTVGLVLVIFGISVGAYLHHLDKTYKSEGYSIYIAHSILHSRTQGSGCA